MRIHNAQTGGTHHNSMLMLAHKGRWLHPPGQFIALQAFNLLKDTISGYVTAFSVLMILSNNKTYLLIWSKIYLHDQGEIPQMQDQGFAVAPGTHTLVATKRVEVEQVSVSLAVMITRNS